MVEQGEGMSIASRAKRITTNTLQEMKANNEKIAMLTAYDYSLARLVDSSGIDVILVGDSASNVMAGHETTVPITLDQMIYHAQSVVRAVQRALVVVDMPFGTYQSDSNNALKSAIRIMKETGGHAVKLEGGKEVLPAVRKIIDAGIPVMGHLGLTPQSIYKFGTYSVRAKQDEEAARLMEDAMDLQEAGCFSIVFEKIPAKLAAKVSSSLTIPTIGIGAGVDCDGQVLVLHDMLGITQEFSPRFLRRYADLENTIDAAITSYISDVRAKSFPSDEESY
ncbi:MAG: 3-methyl-2-oxobutanoate hydroxymethyltransferase [Candidatus Thalassarchaeaceae archaeon]|nr:3-methyl-2-oxobutanoate hydroxymethyltransferase [Candidatus Thalassarchaeaceae archaeon]